MLVSKKIKPLHAVSHFPVMSHTHQIPLLTLTTASDHLGSLLGLRSVTALAFDKNTSDAAMLALVGKLSAFASIQSLPWLPRKDGLHPIVPLYARTIQARAKDPQRKTPASTPAQG
jgi:hypothetical protein